MKRTFVVAVVLCLAATAALAIGAAPAQPRDGCACHTAVPPTNGAPAAHVPYVAGVSACTTCHKGMKVPHPKLVKPRLSFGAGFGLRPNGKPYVDLGYRLARPGGLGLNGVVIYLQQRPPGVTAFLDLRTATTHKVKRIPLAPGYNHPDGWFGARVTSPIWGGTYRAVSRGVAGKTVVEPAFTKTILYPGFGVWMRGPDENNRLKLGHSVVASGTAYPAELLAGEKVKLTLLQWWKVRAVGEATIGSDGTYSWEVTPTLRGPGYKVRARLPATAEHWGVTRGTAVNFRVE
jgi:hypothetical protein